MRPTRTPNSCSAPQAGWCTSRPPPSGRTAGAPPETEQTRANPARSGVQRLDLGGEVLEQHAAANPELDAELAGFLGEVPVEDPELPDGLRPGDRLVGVIDGVLHGGAQIRVVAQRRDRRVG